MHLRQLAQRSSILGLAACLSTSLLALNGGAATARSATPEALTSKDCLVAAATVGDAEAAYTCLHPADARPRAASDDPPLPAPLDTSSGCDVPGVDDQCESWTASYHDPEAGTDSAQFPADIALSRDGSTAFVVVKDVHGTGFDSRSQIAVVAYDAATGNELWTSKWGAFDRYSFTNSIAVSPDGRYVYVTGCERGEFIDPDGHLTTLAFDAATGEHAWTATYDGPAGTDTGRDISVDPTSQTVYVSGVSAGTNNGDLDYVFLAYDAVTGEQRWVTRWDGIGTGGVDSPFSMSLSPDGHYMYATGWSAGEGEFNVDYGTLALATDGPDAGTILWTQRFDGPGTHAPDEAFALALSPLGDTVYVTGLSDDVPGGPPFDVNYSYATVAYDSGTGEKLWEARKQWSGTNFNAPNAIATDRDGERVYVTGQTSSETDKRNLDIGTVTYDSTTGAELWSDRYGLPDHDLELSKTIAVPLTGNDLYVAGISSDSRTKSLFLNQAQLGDQITVGYDGVTGAKTWIARYNSSGYDFDVALASAVSRDSSMLYTATALTHDVSMESNFYDAGTLAYELGPPLEPPAPPSTSLSFTDRSATTGAYSDDALVQVRLTREGDVPVAREHVTFSLGNGTYAATTNGDGIASLPLALTEAPGAVQLGAAYPGKTDAYGGSDASADFVVTKEGTVLTLVQGRDGATKTLRAVLTDDDASPSALLGQDIVFSAGGKTIGTATTDGSGVAQIVVPRKLQHATSFDAGFAGTDYFSRSAASLRDPKHP